MIAEKPLFPLDVVCHISKRKQVSLMRFVSSACIVYLQYDVQSYSFFLCVKFKVIAWSFRHSNLAKHKSFFKGKWAMGSAAL